MRASDCLKDSALEIRFCNKPVARETSEDLDF